MDSFSFGLRLVDQATTPGKKIADAMRQVQQSAKKAQDSLDFSKELNRAEAALKKLNVDPTGYKKLIAAQKELREQQKKMGREGFTDAFKDKLSFGRMTGAAFLGDLLAESLIEGAKSAVELIGEGIKKAFEAGAKSEVLRVGEKLSLRGEAGGFREDVGRFSKLTGFDDDNIRGMLLKTRRAGFNQQGARTAFAAAADVAAGEGQGGNAGRVQELLDAFTHIKLKGGVQERLLPNLGVDVKQFYASLAGELKLGKGQAGIDAAKKRAEEGKVDPQLLLNTIYRGIESKQGGKLGTGAIAYSKTFESRAAKLANLPEEYLKAVSESPAWDKLSEKMGQTLSALDPDSPRGKKIVSALINDFDKLTTAFDKFLTPENVDKFADDVTHALEMISKIPDYMDKIVTASEVIGTIWAGSKIIGGFTSLVELLPGIATAAGSASAAIGALAAPLLATAAAVGSVAFAYERISKTADELYTSGKGATFLDDLKFAVSGKSAVASDQVNDNSPAWKKNKAVQIHAPVNVVIHGADGDTGKKVGEDIHRNASNALERAANG